MPEYDLSSDLRTAVLQLGLEGQIALPEATETAAMRVGEENAVPRLREIMEDLLRAGQIRIYRGRTKEDPVAITLKEAETLLTDPKWYRYRVEDQDEERLHYVNVDNLLNP